MKDNICVFILAVILLVLVGRIYQTNQKKMELETLSTNELSMSSFEGEIFAVSKTDANRKDMEDLPEYSKLYPDLYIKKEEGLLPYEEMLTTDLEKRNNYLNKISKDKKIAYLTFDDGPSNITKEIIKVLDEKNVKATFFVIGSCITEEYEQIIKELCEKGHKIGIHTNSHKFTEIYCSVENYLKDFYQVYERIYEVTGEKVSIFRFPGGSTSRFCRGLQKQIIPEMERRGFVYYDWNLTADDSIGKPSEYIIQRNILKNLNNYQQPVILMHDSPSNILTARALGGLIDSIRREGYEFGLVEEREPCHFN